MPIENTFEYTLWTFVRSLDVDFLAHDLFSYNTCLPTQEGGTPILQGGMIDPPPSFLIFSDFVETPCYARPDLIGPLFLQKKIHLSTIIFSFRGKYT